jgi:hypothetical protein
MYYFQLTDQVTESLGDDPQQTIEYAVEIFRQMRLLEFEFARITFARDAERETLEGLRDLCVTMHYQARYSRDERHLLEVRMAKMQDQIDKMERELNAAQQLRSGDVFAMLSHLAAEVESITPFPYPRSFERSLREDGIKVFPVMGPGVPRVRELG